MAIQLPHPALGIIIPAFLIEFIGHASHYFIFRHYFSYKRQLFFEACLGMIWISYYIAIKKSPGYAPKEYQPKSGDWKRWCKKCEAFKPERAHHCKTCKRCVLKMDHHCPWTVNCVGYQNMPHFMRFLFWVDFTTAFVLYELFKRGIELWDMKNFPAYMFRRSEIVFLFILVPMDGFILLTVGLLTLKCLVHITSGMSQIETWEWERIESQMHSERFWDRIRANYQKVHGKKMPKLTSIKAEEYFYYKNTESAQKSDHFLYSMDDIVFPYDYGFIQNIFDQLNYPWLWLVPWAGPLGNGVDFEKTDLVEEDQLGLPWPPDGGRQELEEVTDEPHVVFKEPKRQWVNSMGERLGDYGVDEEVAMD